MSKSRTDDSIIILVKQCFPPMLLSASDTDHPTMPPTNHILVGVVTQKNADA